LTILIEVIYVRRILLNDIWSVCNYMRWDGTGRKIFKNRPVPWDEKFLKVVPSHGTNFFSSVPWDHFFRPVPSHAEPWYTYIIQLDGGTFFQCRGTRPIMSPLISGGTRAKGIPHTIQRASIKKSTFSLDSLDSLKIISYETWTEGMTQILINLCIYALSFI